MSSSGQTIPPVTIRSYQDSDLAACQTLYTEGLIGGKIADNDTAIDIDDISTAFMRSEGSHFWVAQTDDGQVVGMIGLQQHEPGVGEMRRLRVAQNFRRRGIGSALMETALKFCEDHGLLKITLDTFMEREPALKLFGKFSFKHSATREVNDKQLMYFYLDLYAREPRKAEE